MPFKSEAQRRYFEANKSKLQKQGVDVKECRRLRITDSLQASCSICRTPHSASIARLCTAPGCRRFDSMLFQPLRYELLIYRLCKKQYLCNLSSVRTRPSEKAAATVDTQQGESNHVLAAIPSSSQSAEPANHCGLGRWSKA
jgi:hypothetical protein